MGLPSLVGRELVAVAWTPCTAPHTLCVCFTRNVSDRSSLQIRYHEAFLLGSKLCTVMEYAPYGDLRYYISKGAKLRAPFPEEAIWRIFLQLCKWVTWHRRVVLICHPTARVVPLGNSNRVCLHGVVVLLWSTKFQLVYTSFSCHTRTRRGLQALHGQSIIHRDIKPANIFLCANDLLKIGDLGIAKALTNNHFAKTQIGTPCYMAPDK